ncbi:hypothetical protein E2320_009916 [Naja naja]|nr:hypothetical protein E2320_009916 [Naja naja]
MVPLLNTSESKLQSVVRKLIALSKELQPDLEEKDFDELLVVSAVVPHAVHRYSIICEKKRKTAIQHSPDHFFGKVEKHDISTPEDEPTSLTSGFTVMLPLICNYFIYVIDAFVKIALNCNRKLIYVYLKYLAVSIVELCCSKKIFV